jgi:quinol-cytochrome oxidoreductase complex cytochrome b subunit
MNKAFVMGWIKSRFPVDTSNIYMSLQEPVPNHLKRWWWCLGGMPAYLFVVQLISGILLTFYYVPDPAQAYESVHHITFDIPFGWWVRSIHKWSSNLMIISVILHVMRVFFSGAYRKPREINWMFGAGLLLVTLAFGFTGYSLVYEQLSYWGVTVAANLAQAVPWIGEYIANFIRGGDSFGANTLTRFFVFHIGILPTAIVVLMGLHIMMVRTLGVTELHFKNEDPGKTFRFFPDHILTELLIGVGLLIVISAVAVIFPPGLGEKANPLITPAHIKPEWYFYFSFRWLKMTGLTTAVITMGIAMVGFIFWPLIDSLLSNVTKRDLSIPLGVIAVISLFVLTLVEALGY